MSNWQHVADLSIEELPVDEESVPQLAFADAVPVAAVFLLLLLVLVIQLGIRGGFPRGGGSR